MKRRRARYVVGSFLIGIGDVLIGAGMRVRPSEPTYPGYSSNGELDDGMEVSRSGNFGGVPRFGRNARG